MNHQLSQRKKNLLLNQKKRQSRKQCQKQKQCQSQKKRMRWLNLKQNHYH